MSLILDGTAGVTFPSGSGTQGAQSKVLQVVSAQNSIATSTTSTSFVTTNVTASITPLFSTSKILVLVFGGGNDNGSSSGNYINTTIYRNSTNIGNASTGFNQTYGSSSRVIVPCAMQAYDSPATTSSTTYDTVFANGQASGTTYVQYSNGNDVSTITLMEIAQ